MEVTFSAILLLAALIPGLIFLKIRTTVTFGLSELLIFASAFIFSITIIHLLPELFTATAFPGRIGLFILLGFFMQIILDFFTSGIEHGHLHAHSHHHSRFSPLIIMIGLFIHAFMDGSILVHPATAGAETDSTGLLIGIVLHKIPATIALMTVLQATVKKKKALLILLLVFSIASPLGLFSSEMLNRLQLVSHEGFLIIFAIISGNFLHISTTIYFETSPDHSFQKKKILISILGAATAMLVEWLQH